MWYEQCQHGVLPYRSHGVSLVFCCALGAVGGEGMNDGTDGGKGWSWLGVCPRMVAPEQWLSAECTLKDVKCLFLSLSLSFLCFLSFCLSLCPFFFFFFFQLTISLSLPPDCIRIDCSLSKWFYPFFWLKKQTMYLSISSWFCAVALFCPLWLQWSVTPLSLPMVPFFHILLYSNKHWLFNCFHYITSQCHFIILSFCTMHDLSCIILLIFPLFHHRFNLSFTYIIISSFHPACQQQEDITSSVSLIISHSVHSHVKKNTCRKGPLHTPLSGCAVFYNAALSLDSARPRSAAHPGAASSLCGPQES